MSRAEGFSSQGDQGTLQAGALKRQQMEEEMQNVLNTEIEKKNKGGMLSFHHCTSNCG